VTDTASIPTRAPRQGDKVRVSFDATYDGPCGNAGAYVRVRCGRPDHQVYDGVLHVPSGATVEVLAAPEDLRAGDVYLTADGVVVMCVDPDALLTDALVWTYASLSGGSWRRDHDVARPLTLLVRDGQVQR
jgi:hypothetical protein